MTAGRFYLVAILTSLVAAALMLMLMPRSVGYDPWSWLVWGRELARGRLDTSDASSSFKPYPVFLNAMFAWTGSALPSVWLLIARAGSVMAVILVFRLGCRLGSFPAGVIAVAGLLTSLQYVSYLTPDGMSEPTGAALCLAAVDAHLDRRRWRALILLTVAGLVRIELWAFVAGYGVLWLIRAAKADRARILATAVLLLVVLPLAWILPDLIGSGDALRSAAAATQESQGGPLLSAVPGLASLGDATTILAVPLTVAFMGELGWGAVVWVRRREIRPAWPLALAALALVLVEAVMAEARVATGAVRYSLPAAAVACAVAGATWAEVTCAVARWWARRRAARGTGRRVVVAVVSVVVLAGGSLSHVHGIRTGVTVGWRVNAGRAVLFRHLPAAFGLAGGRERMLTCGTVVTANDYVTAVAWYLDVRLDGVRNHPTRDGTVLQVAGEPVIPAALQAHYHQVGRTASAPDRAWTVYTTC